MKKISLITAIVFIALATTSCSKGGGMFDPYFLPPSQQPTLLGVSQDFSVATVSYAGQQIQVSTVYSPFFDAYGNMVRQGRNGQGIMVVPPIRPQSWEQNYSTGRWVANGFVYNEGMSAYGGSCFIVRGNWTPNGQSLQFSVVRISGSWSQTPNPATWVGMYQPNQYYPPATWYGYVSVYLDRAGYELGL